MSTEPTARFLGAAVEIARMPGVAARLHGLHVAGRDGRCRACRPAGGVAPVWPCRLSLLAVHALGVEVSGPRGR